MRFAHRALRSCNTCVASVKRFVPPVTEYVRLAACLVTPVHGTCEVRLRCETDERGDAFDVACSLDSVLHLQPYAALLRGYQQGESIDQPVVPVRRFRGALTFDPAVAELDYPELVTQLNQRLDSGLLPDFVSFAADLTDLS